MVSDTGTWCDPIFPRILLPSYSVDNSVVCADGSETAVDAVIWCTRFKPALGHLASLRMITEEGRVAVEGARAVNEHRLWLVGGFGVGDFGRGYP